MQLAKKEGRIWQLDLLKALAIFFVIWGHSVQQLSDYDYRTNPCYLFIYSFHMPLFMTISGFFASKICSCKFQEMVKHRSRQLLLPVLAWSLIIFGTEYIMYRIGVAPSYEPLITSRLIGGGSLWFLKSAFICTVLLWLANSFTNKTLGFIITLLFSQLIFYYLIMVMYPCFLIGFFLNKNLNWIVEKKKPIIVICGTLFIVGAVYISFFNTSINTEMWNLNLGIKNILFSGKLPNSEELSTLINYIGYRYFRMIIGMLASITLICIMFSINSIPMSKSFDHIYYIGQNTLSIYVIQTVVLETVLRYTIKIKEISLFEFNLIIAPIISLLVLYICLIIKMSTSKWGGPMPYYMAIN